MKALGSQIRAAKPAIREMARNELIDDPSVWFEFIDTRNASSYPYDESVAESVFKSIEKFLPEAIKLASKLEGIL